MKILFSFYMTFILIASSALCISQQHTEGNENNFDILTKPDNYNLETGKRYLKLAMTYREARDTDKAEEYLRKGMDIIKKHNNIYWEAVAYEFLAYVLRDKHQPLKAIMMMEKALTLYDMIIKQEDGSQYAARRVINIIKTESNANDNDKAKNESIPPKTNPINGKNKSVEGMDMKDQIALLYSKVNNIRTELFSILEKKK